MFNQIFDAIEEWMRELLTGMISSNLDRMFTDVNQKTSEIAGQVGQTPQGCVVVKHFCNTLFENSPGISSFKWCFPIIVGMRTDMIVPYVHISV